jgi:hypothetical protein
MDSDGGNVVGWGFHNGSGFTEVDGSGNVLFQVSFPNNEYGYRSIKIPAGDIDINLLRQTVGASTVSAPSGAATASPNATAPAAKSAAVPAAGGSSPKVTSTSLPCTTDVLASALSSQASGQLSDAGALTAIGGPSCAKGWASQTFTSQSLGTVHALFETTGSPPEWNVTAFGRAGLCTDSVPAAAIAALGKQLGC